MVKFILHLTLILFSLKAYSQHTAPPNSGHSFYQTLDISKHLAKSTHLPTPKALVQESFFRYAPKSLNSRSKILKRTSNPNYAKTSKPQDLGWLFETLVKNKYGFNYVKSSTAELNDLTTKLPDGRTVNAQLKFHKSGNPKIYRRDLLNNGYNSLFIVPDDHIDSLKNVIEKMLEERNYLRELKIKETIDSKKTNRLRYLESKNLESKISRIQGGGFTASEVSKTMDDGIRALIKAKAVRAISGITAAARFDAAITIGVSLYEEDFSNIHEEIIGISASWAAASLVEYYIVSSSSSTGIGALPAATYLVIRLGTSYLFSELEKKRIQELEEICNQAEQEARWQAICAKGDLVAKLYQPNN